MLPNYKNGSIVNLMSTISNYFKVKSQYNELKILKSKELKSKNIVLIILDGLGDNTLNYHSKNGILNKNKIGIITSVFPSTTASAITTFATGLPPKQTGIIGWHQNHKELGAIFTPLKGTPRMGGVTIGKIGIDFIKFYGLKPLGKKINTYVTNPHRITESEFNISASMGSKVMGYETLKQMFVGIKEATKFKEKKLIIAYFADVDSLSHAYGYKHKKVKESILEIEKHIEKLKLKNTEILITADHGHMISNKSETIIANNIPGFMDCLSMPLSGEGRAAMLFVRPHKVKDFKKIYNKYLKSKFELKTLNQQKAMVGLGEDHPQLESRLGDFMLVGNKNYMIKDLLFGDTNSFHKGHHGGTSKKEMEVPLIHIK